MPNLLEVSPESWLAETSGGLADFPALQFPSEKRDTVLSVYT